MQNKLCKPFAFNEVEWRVGNTFDKQGQRYGIAMPYITRTAIQKRLDEVFGFLGWKNEFKEWHNNVDSDGVIKPSQLCGISIYDTEHNQWITKWDGASDTTFESIKGGLSDSFKRAATMLGIGRYLYDMDACVIPVTQRNGGKGYIIDKTILQNDVYKFYQNQLVKLGFSNSSSTIFNTNANNTNNSSNSSNNSNSNNSNKPNHTNDKYSYNKNTYQSNQKLHQNNNVAPIELISAIKSMLTFSKKDINLYKVKYRINALEDLTISQANEIIKDLSVA